MEEQKGTAWESGREFLGERARNGWINAGGKDVQDVVRVNTHGAGEKTLSERMGQEMKKCVREGRAEAM